MLKSPYRWSGSDVNRETQQKSEMGQLPPLQGNISQHVTETSSQPRPRTGAHACHPVDGGRAADRCGSAPQQRDREQYARDGERGAILDHGAGLLSTAAGGARRSVAGLRNQRHVAVTLAARMPERGVVLPADRKPGATVPSWVEPAEPPVIRVPVDVNGRDLGTILIAGDGSDEMMEVWETIGQVALYGSVFALFAFAVTSWLIRTSLQPVDTLHEALTHLEAGDYDVDIPTSGSPEIAGICTHINALAAALPRPRRESPPLHRHRPHPGRRAARACPRASR